MCSSAYRWALSYNLRSEIAEKTHKMLGVVQDDTFSHNESTRGRIVRDGKDEQSLISVLEQHNVFLATSHRRLFIVLYKRSGD